MMPRQSILVIGHAAGFDLDNGPRERYGVELLGTPLRTIKLAADRAIFKEAMLAIGEPDPASAILIDTHTRTPYAA